MPTLSRVFKKSIVIMPSCQGKSAIEKKNVRVPLPKKKGGNGRSISPFIVNSIILKTSIFNERRSFQNNLSKNIIHLIR